jgi:hypothetical protein
MGLYLRNVETGAIKEVDPDSKEFNELKAQRTEDGRFPLYEQTSAADADPKNAASPEEVALRERHDLPISDVTSDGVAQSDKSVAVLEKAGADTVDPPSGKK